MTLRAQSKSKTLETYLCKKFVLSKLFYCRNSGMELLTLSQNLLCKNTLPHRHIGKDHHKVVEVFHRTFGEKYELLLDYLWWEGPCKAMLKTNITTFCYTHAECLIACFLSNHFLRMSVMSFFEATRDAECSLPYLMNIGI